MSSLWLLILALVASVALVVRVHMTPRGAERHGSSAWDAFWREHYRPADHQVGVLLGDVRYVGTVKEVDEVVATRSVLLEDVTVHSAATAAEVRLNAPVYFEKGQPFHVYLVDR